MTLAETKKSYPHLAADYVRKLQPDFKPRVGIVLGSGLGQFVDTLTHCTYINYADLPGFPELTVAGHASQMILGYCGDVGVVCLQGRAHTYEGPEHYDTVKTYVRTLKLLGCEHFIATNASGSLRAEVGPGELVLISDHINLQPFNPLVGPNDEAFGPRFYPLDNAYDKHMRENMLTIADKHSIRLWEGVYISVLGPHYETAAEIRAFTLLGAEVIGMSTVPEVLVANHCGMKVAVIATITNLATGLASESHSHEAVVKMANQASEKLNTLVGQYISEFL